MLHLVRNNNPFTVIILIIYGLLVNLQVLFHPVMPGVIEGQFLYNIIVNFGKVVLFNSAFAFALLTVVMQILQGIYLNAVANKHKLFYKPSYVVAFAYISLNSLYPGFGIFSEAVLTNWLLIILINIILQFTQATKPRKLVYNAGFAVGMATLINFSNISYVLVLFIALSMLRSVNPGEWIVAMLGIITPIYFTAGILFLFDVLYWLPEWVDVGINLPSKLENPVSFVFLLMSIITLFGMGTYVLQGNMNKLSVFTRRSWSAIAICMFLSIATAVFTDSEVVSAWLVVMPALALVTANAFCNEKNKAFSNFAFYFTLVLVIFCEMAM